MFDEHHIHLSNGTFECKGTWSLPMFDPDLCDQSFEAKFKTGCLFEWYVPNSVEETEINMCGCQIYLLVNNTVILIIIIIICLFSSLMHKNGAGGNTHNGNKSNLKFKSRRYFSYPDTWWFSMMMMIMQGWT